MQPRPQLYNLSIMGEDRVGVMAELTAAVDDLNGNIEALFHGLLENYFVVTLMVAFPREITPEIIKKTIRNQAGENPYQISVLPQGAYTKPAVTGERFILTLRGPDQPGICRATTVCLAAHNVDIEDFKSQHTGDVFTIIARLLIPAEVGAIDLRQELNETLKPFNIRVSLLHENIFNATNRIHAEAAETR